jgi:hypothetical protein
MGKKLRRFELGKSVGSARAWLKVGLAKAGRRMALRRLRSKEIQGGDDSNPMRPLLEIVK